MKRFLFIVLFLGLGFGACTVQAQSNRDQFTGIQKNDDGVLLAYPNPTRDVLLLKAKDPAVKVKSVSFYSILGMQVATYNVNMNSAEINLERLRPGKYLMRYTMSDNTQKIKQIIKQ
jgi:hypothetical protein